MARPIKKLDFTKEFIFEQFQRETNEYKEDSLGYLLNAMAFKITTDLMGTRGYINADIFENISNQVIDAIEEYTKEHM